MATTEWLRVYNDQAAVECCGYALDGEVLVLLDIVGYKTACKSIWASTVNHPRKPFHITGNLAVCGGEIKLTKYRAFWAELPEQNSHNLVICNLRLLDATPDPNVKFTQPFYLTALHANADDPTLHGRFVALLNQSLELPILPTWAKWLWQAGMGAELVAPIIHGGCIAGAWRVLSTPEAWAEVVQRGLREQAISLSE